MPSKRNRQRRKLGNWHAVVREEFERLGLDPAFYECTVIHDEWCAMLTHGGICDCSPTVEDLRRVAAAGPNPPPHTKFTSLEIVPTKQHHDRN